MSHSQLMLCQFAARVQLLANDRLEDEDHVSRQFVEHMTIVGLLDVEAAPELQVSEVVTQVVRAKRLGVWASVC